MVLSEMRLAAAMRFRSSYSGVARRLPSGWVDDFYRDFAKASFYFFRFSR